MRPIPSPVPPSPDAHDTGEFVAANPQEAAFFTKKEKRILKRALIAIASMVGLTGAGGATSHFMLRQHTDEVVEVRVQALERGQEQLQQDVRDVYKAVMWGEHSTRLERDGGL